MAQAKADFSLLWGDEQLADVTIKIKIKPEEPAPAAPAAAVQDGSIEQQEGQGQEQEGSQRPAAKRRRTEDGEGVQEEQQHEQAQEQKQEQQEEKEQEQQQQQEQQQREQEQEGEAMMVGGDVEAGVVATLRVHGTVLVQRSAYFKGLLLGAGAAMIEGQGKTLTVEVDDEQEVADFQRLIKLSCLPSYTKNPDNGRRLGKEELMRLLVVADRFEMVWCVEECARALRSFRDYDEAVAYFRIVPDSLLQTPPLSKSTKATADVLAEALGPVEKLWQPNETHTHSCTCPRMHTLVPRVAQLPIGGIEALLRSEELQLKSENYAFSLALWWINEQEGTQQVLQPLFNRLLKSPRYARMSAAFLASIVDDPWVVNSGLLPYIMQRALWRRDAVPRSFDVHFPPSRVQNEDSNFYSCIFTTHFTRTAVEALQQPGDDAKAPLGLLHGFPCYLQLEREDDDEFGLYLSSWSLQTHDAGPFHTPGEPRWEGQDKDEHRGFEYTLVRGKLGPINLPQNMPCDERVADSTCLLTFPANELAYDANGKLEVVLELGVFQHSSC